MIAGQAVFIRQGAKRRWKVRSALRMMAPATLGADPGGCFARRGFIFSRLPARARFKGFGAGVRRGALYWLPVAVRLGGGAAPARRRGARRGTRHGAVLRPVPPAHRPAADRIATARVGRSLRRGREITGSLGRCRGNGSEANCPEKRHFCRYPARIKTFEYKLAFNPPERLRIVEWGKRHRAAVMSDRCRADR